MSRITDLCRKILDGYAAGHSGLDPQVLPFLVELGDHAETLIELEAALNEKAGLALEMSVRWGREQKRNDELREKLKNIQHAARNLMDEVQRGAS